MSEEYKLLGEKARDIITDILASWYNFAVAHFLNEGKLICWSITANYYSMMLATRGLVILLVFEDSNKEEYRDLRNYIKGHARLIKLLKNDGSNDNVINWWWDSANFELYEDLLKQHG